MGSWVLEMEEEGSEGGFIPERSRVRKPYMNFDLIKRVGVMTCLRVDKRTGELKEQKKEVTW